MKMRWIALAFLVCAVASADEQLGTIVFPNTGKPEAQAAFLRGVLLLHNFAYPQAARAFVEAEQIDPNFALAYWGEAMTYNHPIWMEVSPEDGRRALKKTAALKTTPRERAYLDALGALYGEGEKEARDLAYEKAMESLARAYPEDVEARVFWGLSVLGTMRRGEVDGRKQIRTAAILEELYPTRPDHPGVLHYLIHAYDDPLHAPLGLRAARRYAKVASSAPHALHMPSHIFLQLGMWNDAARSNELAYALSQEWVEREHAASDQRDLHSLQWLQYVYLQQGRYTEAKRLLDEVKPYEGEKNRELHARENMQARYAVETGDWKAFDFTHPFARGMRAVAEKRFDDVQRAIESLSTKKHGEHYSGRGNEADVERLELLAMLAAARGDMNEALRSAALAVEAEKILGVPSGPPDAFKPANELYGELLLKAGRPKEALEQFRTSLFRTPNRAASLAGAAQASQVSVTARPSM